MKGAAAAVLLAGMAAALHVGKLPPAVPVLQASLGVSLVQASFLLSLVQGASMLVGVAAGAWVDGLGHRRAMVWGLGLLTVASTLGAWADSPTMLMLLRAVEGLGFMLSALPAPALLRGLVAPAALPKALGLWGTYMPVGTAVALLAGPWVMQWAGWPAWWLVCAAITGAAWWGVWHTVPRAHADAPRPAQQAHARSQGGYLDRLKQTLRAPGPWAVGITFGLYAMQWLAVIGFLPTIYAQAGYSLAATATLTALAAAMNIVGNVVAGRWLARGVAPTTLLWVGLFAMATTAWAAFAASAASPTVRYVAVLLFSALGGLVPATLFASAARLAPSPDTMASTMGWAQQWSSVGQFVGPPLAAAMAAWAGGWHFTWVVTGAGAALGMVTSAWLGRCLNAKPGAVRAP